MSIQRFHKEDAEAQTCPICNPSACSEATLAEAHSQLELASNRIFILTKADVIACAKQMGIPEEAITDDVLDQVKKGVEWGLDYWPQVIEVAINLALKG